MGEWYEWTSKALTVEVRYVFRLLYFTQKKKNFICVSAMHDS